MTATISETGPDLFGLMAEMPGLIFDAELALSDGLYANDPDARAQAEQCIADGRRLFSELLREAWPDDTQTQPHDEAIKQEEMSQGYEVA